VAAVLAKPIVDFIMVGRNHRLLVFNKRTNGFSDVPKRFLSTMIF
jgi:hypothetical protein